MMAVPASLIGGMLLSFILAYLAVPIFNRFMVAVGIVGRDVMKRDSGLIPDMGGPGVMVGFLLGVFLYIGVDTFVTKSSTDLISILASLCTVLIITLIGIFDVLTALMKTREGEGIFEKMKRKGIPQWLYFFIPLPAAVPLMAVAAGVTFMSLPFIGRVDFGLFYPLLLVPLAVLCCSNATNFLAGFNGLEAGMGTVLLVSIGVYALMNNRLAAAMLSLVFAAALVAFLRYNWYPAKVFPGDLNYTIGAVVACVTVLGKIDKFAIICFAPWIAEAFLKAAHRFEAENYGVLQADGTVKPKDDRIRSLTHVIMRAGKFKESQVSAILIGTEILVCALAFALVRLI